MSTTKEQIDAAYQDGRNAGVASKSFATNCPYKADRFPGITQSDFDELKRPLLDAWFKGWKETYSAKGKP